MANPASERSLALSLPPSLFENVELPALGTPPPPVNRNLKPKRAGGASGVSVAHATVTNAASSHEIPQTSDAASYMHAIDSVAAGEKNSPSHGIKLKSLFKFFGIAKGKKKETAAIPKPLTHSQAAVATLEACLPRIMNMDRFFEIKGILRTAALPAYQKSAEKDLIAFMDEMSTEPNDECYKALGFALKKLVEQSLDLEEKIVLAITAGVTADFLEQHTDAGTLAQEIYLKLQSGEINSETKCPKKLVDLARLCQKIVQNEGLNLMGWGNLGIIFGPNIFPSLVPKLGVDFRNLQIQLNCFAQTLLESWGVNTLTLESTSSSFFTDNIGRFRSSMRRSVHAAMANPRKQFEDHIYDTVADLQDNSSLLGDSDDDSDIETADMLAPHNKVPIPKPRTAKSLGAAAMNKAALHNSFAPEAAPRARVSLVPLQAAARQTQKVLKRTAVAKPVFSSVNS